MNIRTGILIITILTAGLIAVNAGLAKDDGKNNLKDIAKDDATCQELLEETYRLGSGDRLRINVFGEKDLSGEFQIGGSGNISFPLLGDVKARGLTLRELEQSLVKSLKNGYLVNPRITLEVLNYRPFYILGEVNKPGMYEYVNGINLYNAVAMAGGYTPRAKQNHAKITRGTPEVVIDDANHSTLIMPGDIIYIGERFF